MINFLLIFDAVDDDEKKYGKLFLVAYIGPCK